jgi:hypothetical protein
MSSKVNDDSEHADLERVPNLFSRRQNKFGAQSLRGGVSLCFPDVIKKSAHAKACFKQFLKNEKQMCGEWAVFYHSYSQTALLYEVQAALAAVLFGFPSAEASLPRLIFHKFTDNPSASKLMKSFHQNFRINATYDGHSDFMDVGLSVMCSLLAKGPEASPIDDFFGGYQDGWQVSLRGLLYEVLESCGFVGQKMEQLLRDINAAAENAGLVPSEYHGPESQSANPGHLLQIFVRRDLVDHLAYAAHPFGAVDETRQPLSQWLDGDASFEWGQARLIANPEYLMKPSAVRMFMASADPIFHAKRKQFQERLVFLFSRAIGDKKAQEHASAKLYGGVLPEWLI